ncbi:MAG TPA: peptidoglycan DD-metalloendopeptidase family protein [Patescibacteria group bacterium]|nr:peptidoglycan DD-metalloendopeptidase family protein [Patescibacteria group bacterium]
MKTKTTHQFRSTFLGICILLVAGIAACQQETVTIPIVGIAAIQDPGTIAPDKPSAEPEEVETGTKIRTQPPTLTPHPTDTRQVTPTADQTISATVIHLPTATLTPTAISSLIYSMTATAIALADPIERTCPEPPPVKPDYNHYYLSGAEWPVPEIPAEEHFWLSKPLPGGGRFLYTDWLPYGFDAGGRYLLHTGVDSAEPEGTPVLAAASGTVIVAGEDKEKLYGWRCDWYGHLVVIELADRWRNQPVYVLYGHVLNISVEPGQHISQGEQVAEVGFGGAATLPHLHMEVRVGSNEFGSTRNPFLWLTPPPTRGLIVGRLVDPEGRPWQGVTVAAVGRSEDTETYRSWTYLDDPQHLIRPDEEYAENFVIADILPGEYELYIEIQDEVYQVPISVRGGELAGVEIVTLPLKTPDLTLTLSPSTSNDPE